MTKFLRFLPAAALAVSMGFAGNAWAETFEIEENFDDDASFAQGGSLPDGWTQYTSNEYNTFYRAEGSYFAINPHSGNYVVGLLSAIPGQVLYTPAISLAAGNQAELEFQAMLPGSSSMPTVRNLGFTVFVGTTPDITQMTELGKRNPEAKKTWERFVYKFTPETDGDYYYAIRLDNPSFSSNVGAAFFDTFFFTGTKPEKVDPGTDPGTDPGVDPDDPIVSKYPGMVLLDPDDANLELCMELPYFENFSDASHYNGQVLPAGWGNTGSVIWRTAALPNLPAASGDYYMTTPESSLDRDERAYTPFFELKKGVTYTISFKTYQQPSQVDVENDIWRSNTIILHAGTQQDSEFIPVVIAEIHEENEYGRWIQHDYTFSPAISGAYTFCFELSGPPQCGNAAVDDLRITSPEDMARPEPYFAAHGLYNLMNSSLVSFDQNPVRLINFSNYAEEIEWETNGLTSNVLPNGDIDVFFPADGEYTIDMTATNAKASRTASKTFTVQNIVDNTPTLPLMGYDPESAYIYGRSNQLTFPTDPDFDFVTGYNHYYSTYAEYYQLPENAEISLNQITFWMGWLNYRSMTEFYDDQRIKPFKVYVYGADENGRLDASKLFGKLETTMDKVFGGSGTSELNGREVQFPEPIKCKGPIYVVFEYSKELDIDPDDRNLTRSYIALGAVRHLHGRTTMYVKPVDTPEGSAAEIGEWAPVSDLDPSLKGLGLNFYLWTSYDKDANSVAIDPMGNCLFAARYADGAIEVSGTKEDEWIAVYDMAGHCMAMQQAQGIGTRIVTELPAGIYIVRGDNGSARFMR